MPYSYLETAGPYEGTNDIHALILGKGQTGIQAFNQSINQGVEPGTLKKYWRTFKQ